MAASEESKKFDFLLDFLPQKRDFLAPYRFRFPFFSFSLLVFLQQPNGKRRGSTTLGPETGSKRHLATRKKRQQAFRYSTSASSSSSSDTAPAAAAGGERLVPRRALLEQRGDQAAHGGAGKAAGRDPARAGPGDDVREARGHDLEDHLFCVKKEFFFVFHSGVVVREKERF